MDVRYRALRPIRAKRRSFSQGIIQTIWAASFAGALCVAMLPMTASAQAVSPPATDDVAKRLSVEKAFVKKVLERSHSYKFTGDDPRYCEPLRDNFLKSRIVQQIPPSLIISGDDKVGLEQQMDLCGLRPDDYPDLSMESDGYKIRDFQIYKRGKLLPELSSEQIIVKFDSQCVDGPDGCRGDIYYLTDIRRCVTRMMAVAHGPGDRLDKTTPVTTASSLYRYAGKPYVASAAMSHGDGFAVILDLPKLRSDVGKLCMYFDNVK